jgi:hypothetical protein
MPPTHAAPSSNATVHMRRCYSGTGFEKVYVREAPLMVTQRVSGSVPICSFVAPVVVGGVEGIVMGIVVPHLFPPAVYTVTL